MHQHRIRIMLALAVVVLWLVNCCTSTGSTCGGGETLPKLTSSKQDEQQHYNIVLLGATGNLASKFLWKALFTIFSRRFVKETVHFHIYAASRKEADAGRKQMSRMLLALIDCGADESLDQECWDMKKRFVEAVQYQRLKTERDFQTLSQKLYENTQSVYGIEPGSPVTFERGRLIYMAIPPSTYATTAKYINTYLRPKIGRPWMRVIIEKPFGHDLESAHSLSKELSMHFEENELYRIDHYLAKTTVKQMLPFRYINRNLYEPLWNRKYIERVEVVMKEREDVASRTSFYNNVGVIRDVMQNHMTEMLSLIALELPDDAGNITSLLHSKVQVLKDMRQPNEHSTLLGQYSTYNHERSLDANRTVNFSRTATFAATVLYVDNKRWRDVPFVLISGKKLDEKASYVRIHFRNNRFCMRSPSAQDESVCRWLQQLVFRVGDSQSPSLIAASRGLPEPKPPRTGWNKQTDTEQFVFGQNSKEMVVFTAQEESEPYVDLIEAAMDGARHLFVSTDFLLASWRVWTSVIKHSENQEPRQYLGIGKDSERLDFFLEQSNAGAQMRFWLNEQNVVHYSSELMSSSLGGLPKMGFVSDTFRGTALVTGNDEEVVFRLVAEIVRLARDKVAAGLDFHLALSGGQTAEVLFAELVESSMPWSRVHLWMVDERCDGSNFASLENHLLSISGLRYQNVHRMPIDIDDEPCKEESSFRGDEIYEKAFRRSVPGASVDFVVLGLGGDGHTASLFPGQPSLEESKRLVIFSRTRNDSAADLKERRMTLTFPAINSARNIAVLVLGAQKHEILKIISDQHSDVLVKHPIVGVKPVTGALTWFIDRAALHGAGGA